MEDVIIVGAGPAGNNAALLLTQSGYKVTVIDYRHDIGNKPCTGIVGKECASKFPIPPEYIYREAKTATFIAPNGSQLNIDTGKTQAYIIDRANYVASFAHKAQAAGASYKLGKRVLNISILDDRVQVSTDSENYTCRSVILASGFGSPLVSNLGLGKVPDYVSGVQVSAKVEDLENLHVYLGEQNAPGFFSWAVPTLPGEALIGLMTRKHAPDHLQSFLESLQSQNILRDVIGKPVKWGIPLRPLKKTYSDRVLVIGDAAGQVKPTTGGGNYYALMASSIAAEILSKALKNRDLSAKALSPYQTRWKQLLSTELESGYSARRLYEYLSDRQIDSIMSQAKTKGFTEQIIGCEDISFDWHSKLIGRMINYPGIHNVLRLINPIFAKLAQQTDI